MSKFVFGFFIILSSALFLLATLNVPPRTANWRVNIGGASFDVRVADTDKTRAQGLSGARGLAENEGMLFLFIVPGTYGFWMKEMRFPIDIVWIRSGAVAGYSENLPPTTGGELDENLKIYYPPGEIDAALEIPAGSVRKSGITEGQSVTIEKN